jgi:hypothetical protein
MFFLDPDLDFLPIPDHGSRGQKGTGSRIRIRNTDTNTLFSARGGEGRGFQMEEGEGQAYQVLTWQITGYGTPPIQR